MPSLPDARTAARPSPIRPIVEMVLAVAVGAAIGWLRPPLAVALKPLADLFLRAIQMIVAPLVFSTLVVGIAGVGNVRSIGRLGLKSIVYFEIATLLAFVAGLIAVHVFQPGHALVLPQASATTAGVAQVPASGLDLLLHLVPTSIVDALARGDILQIVVFATIFGAVLAAMGATARPLVQVLTVTSQAMFGVARLVTRLAPVGIFGAIAYTVGSQGAAVLVSYGRLIAALYTALAVLLVVLIGAVTRYARVPARTFVREVREPFVTAFATTSSDAALPQALDAVERLGVPRAIAAFVVPAGYSFNLDGTALYLSIATVFVAQAAGVELSLAQQIWILLVITVTSKGAAGVPRAAIVVLTATLSACGLPIEGVALLLGVDHLLDMGRSAMNVTGNCLAALVVARWEGELAADRSNGSTGQAA
jgi:proton glutamate symport protein